MRSVVLVFIFLIAVIWDLAQNNGYWIKFVVNQAAQALRMVGIY